MHRREHGNEPVDLVNKHLPFATLNLEFIEPGTFGRPMLPLLMSIGQDKAFSSTNIM